MGTVARRYPFNYQQSMNAARVGDPIPGKVSLQITEENSRNFYRAWSLYLHNGSWQEILGTAPTPPHARAAE